MNTRWFSILSLILLAGPALPVSAQVAVDLPGIKVQTGPQGTSVNVHPGNGSAIDSNVEIEGVAIINGEVYIDGDKVPRGKTRYTSKKSGKSYRIQWGKNGNVSVEEG